MSVNEYAGVVMKAADALANQDEFDRAQVAYLVGLAYRTGYAHGVHDDRLDVEPIGPVMGTPEQARAKRKGQRLAEYERTSGPARYMGGPVPW